PFAPRPGTPGHWMRQRPDRAARRPHPENRAPPDRRSRAEGPAGDQMAIVSLKELLDSGIHFGTSSSLWHPRMAPYLYGKRGGIHIIDIRQTARQLIHAHYYVARLARANKSILFVGTKRQAREVIRDAAKAAGMPYVAERWLGGTLTNFDTVRTSVRRLD